MTSSSNMPTTIIGDANGQPKHADAVLAERELLDRYLASLAERVLATASGEAVPSRSRIPNADIQRSLWLGMLACPAVAAARGRSSTFERFNPASQGFSFRVPALPVRLEVTVSAAVYVALHPTLAEQQVSAASERDDDVGVAAAAAATAASASTKGRALATVWTKLPVGPVKVLVPLDSEVMGEATHGADEFGAAFHAAIADLPCGAQLVRPRTHRGSLPRDVDLSDETTWLSYQADNLIPASDVVGPAFAASVEVEVSAYEDGYEVFLTVLNRTPEEELQTADIAASIRFPPRSVDTRLYEVKMVATVDTDVVSYSLEQVPASIAMTEPSIRWVCHPGQR